MSRASDEQSRDGGCRGDAEASSDELVSAWRGAAADATVEAELLRVYGRVDEAVRVQRPLCLASGRCCSFERFGHLLYVTGLEVAWCLRRAAIRRGHALPIAAVDEARRRGDCPFLTDERLCGAHLERPLGCRIYFCDRSAQVWQETLYEELHRDLVALHERHQIPYRYGEWRTMLATVVGHNE